MKHRPAFFVFVALVAGVSPVRAQTISTHTTVRHHQEVEDTDHATELSQAEDAMAKKDFPAAEKTLLEVTATDPKNYRAWFDLGYIYNATGRQPQSIEAYRNSVTANPAIFESTLNLGIMLARTHDPEAAVFLRKATTLKPSAHQEEGWYRAWLMLGEVLEKSKPSDAIEAFQNAAKLNPTEPEPHLAAGILLETGKQYQQARVEFQKAAELDPKSTEALAGLVNSYSQSGQIADAEPAIRKFLALDPNNATGHVQLGRLLAAQHKWNDATAELEKGLQLQPGDAEAQRQLAAIYLEQKQFDAARPHIEAALQSAPSDAELHHWLGQVDLADKKFPEAQNELLTAVKLKPDLGEAYGDLAFTASETRNYALTLKALEVRAKFLPEVPMTYFLRATAYDHLRDFQQASVNYHKFLDVDGGRLPDQEWQAKHRLIAIEPKK